MPLLNHAASPTRRAALAVGALALGTSLVLTGCASGDKAGKTTTTVSDEAGIGLDGEAAKQILVGALDSSGDSLDEYVDTSDPQTAAAVQVVDAGLTDAGISAGSFSVTRI
ncbi:MAG: hypothetical protein WAW85_05310, partial [Gordonia sp. (in: high G+C Gram-positive bacteria)]|uniref:hypothetical protein n=1 Tax=Gordonia sp. (in: high G+C Gram-positive bacteria) TaxID=84139 RepID=UPI003BB812AD